MEACPYASDPVKCLNEHRYRLLAIKYGEPIECNYCQHARPNAEAAHIPEPGWGDYCYICFGPINREHTTTGLCAECCHRGKTNPGNRSKRGGVKAYWGYRQVANRIAKGKAA